jgi:hypothetical protein
MIEVRVPDRDLTRFENAVHRGLHVLNRLRDGGIPVNGVLFIEGVDSGMLEISADDLTCEQIYRWTPPR